MTTSIKNYTPFAALNKIWRLLYRKNWRSRFPPIMSHCGSSPAKNDAQHHFLPLILKTALLCLVLFLPLGLTADTIILKSGEKLHGIFQGQYSQGYRMLLKDGTVRYVPEEDIKDIQVEEKKQTRQGQSPEGGGYLSSHSWPLELLFFGAPGIDQLKYEGAELPEEVNVGGTLLLEYPSKFSGPALRLGALLAFPFERFLPNPLSQTSAGGYYPNFSFEMGLDISLGLGSKSDSPLEGKSLTGQSINKTEYTYTYTYATFLLGMSYYFHAPKLALSYHLRLPSFGSYTEKLTQEIGETSESESNKGGIKGDNVGVGLLELHIDPAKVGWGLTFSKYWPLSGGSRIGASLFLSQDYLLFQAEAEEEGEPRPEAVQFSNLFIGLGVTFKY